MIDGVVLTVSSVGIASLGLVIFIRDPKGVTNRSFALFALATLSWIIFNYLSEYAASNVLAYTRLTFLAGTFTIYAALRLVAVFPVKAGHKSLPGIKGHVALSAVAAVCSMLPQFVSGVDVGTGHIHTSYLYWIFLGYVVYSVVLFVWLLKSQYGKINTNLEKRQFRVIAIGFASYAFISLTLNVAIPLVANNWSTSRFGPAFTLLLVGAMSYSIVHYRLFDIRKVIARLIAYGVTMVMSALVCGVVAVVLLRILLHVQIDNETLVLFSFIAGMTGFLFHYAQKYVNRTTRRIFYQDGYDLEEVLAVFNKRLVVSNGLANLMKLGSEALTQNLKASQLIVNIYPTSRTAQHMIGDSDFSERELQDIKAAIKKSKKGVINYDLLDNHHSALYTIMNRHSLALIMSLSPPRGEHLGFMALGHKKSGAQYALQDMRMIEIIASELAVAMQNALQFEEIQQFNETLQAKVDTATVKLRQANDRLKVLNETKDDFVSMASHQLRTPLTSIKGYLSMVLEGDMGKITAGQRAMIEQAFTSSQRMAYLISDLLNMSRLRTGRLTVTPGTVSLNKIIEQEIAQLRRMAEGNSVKLIVEEAEELPPVALDETKIRQVIMNLVDNAIYYTGRGGTVTVRLSQTPKSVELRVVDTGIGVPVADQHKLFTRFYRASNAKKVRPDGTGIGLYMVRKVVTALGGSIIFTSKEGKGSTFGFSFPKVAPKVLPTVTSADN